MPEVQDSRRHGPHSRKKERSESELDLESVGSGSESESESDGYESEEEENSEDGDDSYVCFDTNDGDEDVEESSDSSFADLVKDMTKKISLSNEARNRGRSRTKTDSTNGSAIGESGTEDDRVSCNGNISKATRSSSTKGDSDTYLFTRKNLCGKGKRPFCCNICKRHTHLARDCPTEHLDIVPILALSDKLSKLLEDVCMSVLDICEPTTQEVSTRMDKLQRLQQHIQKWFPDVQLHLFGSSKNGFGFRNSDMDICLMFQRTRADDIDQKRCIQELEKILKQCKFVSNVLAIKSAKVPIVKFSFIDPAIEADISLYNQLAIENTQLLLAYCRIDERVRPLGYALKYFAKACGIGDASRGTISSYAYILMLIHFLQQRQLPVLPVLQELIDPAAPRPIIDGWSTYFFRNLKELPESRNQESIGELWTGFFRYYVEDFDFTRNVVSIRQSKPLSKFEKGWNRYSMAIEDPFKRDHNLAAGITDKVFKYIFKILMNARILYGNPVDILISERFSYFFDVSVIKSGLDMPQDRLCRVCGKIGHSYKTCPEKGSTNSSRICRKCKQPGHLRKHCPSWENRKTNGKNDETGEGLQSYEKGIKNNQHKKDSAIRKDKVESKGANKSKMVRHSKASDSPTDSVGEANCASTERLRDKRKKGRGSKPREASVEKSSNDSTDNDNGIGAQLAKLLSEAKCGTSDGKAKQQAKKTNDQSSFFKDLQTVEKVDNDIYSSIKSFSDRYRREATTPSKSGFVEKQRNVAEASKFQGQALRSSKFSELSSSDSESSSETDDDSTSRSAHGGAIKRTPAREQEKRINMEKKPRKNHSRHRNRNRKKKNNEKESSQQDLDSPATITQLKESNRDRPRSSSAVGNKARSTDDSAILQKNVPKTNLAASKENRQFLSLFSLGPSLNFKSDPLDLDKGKGRQRTTVNESCSGTGESIRGNNFRGRGHYDQRGRGGNRGRGDHRGNGDQKGRVERGGRSDHRGRGDYGGRGDLGGRGNHRGRSDHRGRGDYGGRGDLGGRGNHRGRGDQRGRVDRGGRGDRIRSDDRRGSGDYRGGFRGSSNHRGGRNSHDHSGRDDYSGREDMIFYDDDEESSRGNFFSDFSKHSYQDQRREDNDVNNSNRGRGGRGQGIGCRGQGRGGRGQRGGRGRGRGRGN